MKIIAKNKKAHFNYSLLERYEAGLVLQGTEVKALREHNVSIAQAYIALDDHGEAWVMNMKIPPYSHGNLMNHSETRKRKLLLQRKELNTIALRMQAERLTLVPTIIYFKKSRVKIEIALAKGKKLHDKREDEKKKDIAKKIREII